MYAVEDRHHPVPPPLSMDRISAPSVQYPSGPNSLRQSDHLAPVTNYQDGRSWSLQVVQQPIRARMCGFGDKVGDFSAIVDFPPLLTQLTGPETHHSATMHSSDCTRCANGQGNRYQVCFNQLLPTSQFANHISPLQ